MRQFDPSKVAQYLMSPVRQETFGMDADDIVPLPMQQGGFFTEPSLEQPKLMQEDLSVPPGMILPIQRTQEGELQFATPQLVAGILEGFKQAGQTIQKGMSGDPMFIPVDGKLSDQAVDELANLGLTFGGTSYLGSSMLPGLVPKGALASGLKGGKKYNFENPIKVYQGRSKKGTNDFINPTDFYGDNKVSFGTTELVTAEQFANKQTITYPGRARDGSQGPTKTTLIPGDVAELEFDIQNPLEVNRKDIGFSRDNEKAVIADARAKGHDGLKIVNDVSDKVDYVAFDSEQVRVVNPSLYPDRDYDYSPTSAELPSNFENIAKVEPPTETKPGIIAFHGSGADFDEFRLDKIGTGEGNQAFGYGLYFTDSEDIADFYRKSVGGQELTDIKVKGKSIKDLGLSQGAINQIEARASVGSMFLKGDEDFFQKKLNKAQNMSPQVRQSFQEIVDAGIKEKDLDLIFSEGKTFKVGIEAKPENLLDYDKPIGQQNEFVTERLKKVVEEINADDAINLGFDPFELGEKQAIEKAKQNMLDPDRTVVSFLNDWAVFRGSQATGEKLLDKNGIKGIKFLNADARNTFGGKLLSIDKTADGQFRARVVLDDPNRQTGLGGSGRTITTSKTYKTEKEARDWANKSISKEENNYVIFDDKLVKILEKYGIVGPIAVSATAAALRDDGST